MRQVTAILSFIVGMYVAKFLGAIALALLIMFTPFRLDPEMTESLIIILSFIGGALVVKWHFKQFEKKKEAKTGKGISGN